MCCTQRWKKRLAAQVKIVSRMLLLTVAEWSSSRFMALSCWRLSTELLEPPELAY